MSARITLSLRGPSAELVRRLARARSEEPEEVLRRALEVLKHAAEAEEHGCRLALVDDQGRLLHTVEP